MTALTKLDLAALEHLAEDALEAGMAPASTLDLVRDTGRALIDLTDVEPAESKEAAAKRLAGDDHWDLSSTPETVPTGGTRADEARRLASDDVWAQCV